MYTYMLRLIGAVVSGEKLPVPPLDVNWEQVYAISKFHNVANIVAYAVSIENYPMENEIKQKFLKNMFDAVLLDENQKKEFNTLFEAFEENGIEYMPLKGLNLKKHYASSDMRNMCDGDILIHENDRDKINTVMEKLGYRFKKESNHELIYVKEPFINVELHKLLIPSYNDDLYAYYGDGWRLADRVLETSRYTLNSEDEFVYILTHFAKHYRDGGAGIKYILDIWMYLKKNNVDLDYVNRELEKLGLLSFGENIIKLTKVWFENSSCDELMAEMTKYIIDSGMYGNAKNKALVTQMRENSVKSMENHKKSSKFRLIFPTMEHMKRNYTILEKHPYFIAFCWMWRIIRVLIGKTDRNTLKKFEYITSENLAAFDLHMKKVGLDIYNGRNKKV